MLPPAAKPTSTRTGFCGQACAKADGAASDAANAAPDVSSNASRDDRHGHGTHYRYSPNNAVERTGKLYLTHNMGGGVARGRG